MWPDICNIFSHFHCWLVVPPPSWSSGALCTVHCALVHCATPLPVLWWWDPRAQNVTNNFVTTFLLLRALCTFCQRNQRRRWESSSFEQNLLIEVESLSYWNFFRLAKTNKQKTTLFSTFDIRLPQTNKQDKQLCVQHLKSQAVCTYGRENFESWGRKKRSIDGEPVDRYLSYIIFVKNMTFVFYVFLQLIKTLDIVQLLMSLWL